MNTFDQQMQEARKRVADMDAIDGWKPRNAATIWSALECGLKNPATGAQFDALVMLEDVVQQQRAKQ